MLCMDLAGYGNPAAVQRISKLLNSTTNLRFKWQNLDEVFAINDGFNKQNLAKLMEQVSGDNKETCVISLELLGINGTQDLLPFMEACTNSGKTIKFIQVDGSIVRSMLSAQNANQQQLKKFLEHLAIASEEKHHKKTISLSSFKKHISVADVQKISKMVDVNINLYLANCENLSGLFKGLTNDEALKLTQQLITPSKEIILSGTDISAEDVRIISKIASEIDKNIKLNITNCQNIKEIFTPVEGFDKKDIIGLVGQITDKDNNLCLTDTCFNKEDYKWIKLLKNTPPAKTTQQSAIPPQSAPKKQEPVILEQEPREEIPQKQLQQPAIETEQKLAEIIKPHDDDAQNILKIVRALQKITTNGDNNELSEELNKLKKDKETSVAQETPIQTIQRACKAINTFITKNPELQFKYKGKNNELGSRQELQKDLKKIINSGWIISRMVIADICKSVVMAICAPALLLLFNKKVRNSFGNYKDREQEKVKTEASKIADNISLQPKKLNL